MWESTWWLHWVKEWSGDWWSGGDLQFNTGSELQNEGVVVCCSSHSQSLTFARGFNLSTEILYLDLTRNQTWNLLMRIQSYPKTTCSSHKILLWINLITGYSRDHLNNKSFLLFCKFHGIKCSWLKVQVFWDMTNLQACTTTNRLSLGLKMYCICGSKNWDC